MHPWYVLGDELSQEGSSGTRATALALCDIIYISTLNFF